MSAIRRFIGTALILAGCTALAAQAQDDLFAFIPQGGRTLLGDLFASGKASPDEVLSSRRSAVEWQAYLQGLESGLDEAQLQTLAAYLAATMPAAESGGQTLDTNGTALPRDGRDLVLEYCQSCHIITVVVTQDRSREAWLGMMNRASHVEIGTSQQEREALADYLVLNGGIPIEDVPEELRAGGATY